MAKLTRDDFLSKTFVDPANYPYGFSRSGDFSINEAKALQQYGSLISALLSGALTASNDEDKHLVAVACGDAEANSAAEKAWLKYQNRIHRTKAGSIYGSSKSSSDDTDIVLGEDEGLDTDIAITDNED